METGDSRLLGKRPFGKERQGLATARFPDNAAGIHAATVPIETVHELRADPAQQRACQRYTHHFLLDDEAEVRGQGSFQDDAVQVA